MTVPGVPHELLVPLSLAERFATFKRTRDADDGHRQAKRATRPHALGHITIGLCHVMNLAG